MGSQSGGYPTHDPAQRGFKHIEARHKHAFGRLKNEAVNAVDTVEKHGSGAMLVWFRVAVAGLLAACTWAWLRVLVQDAVGGLLLCCWPVSMSCLCISVCARLGFLFLLLLLLPLCILVTKVVTAQTVWCTDIAGALASVLLEGTEAWLACVGGLAFLTLVCTLRTSCEGKGIAVTIDKGAKYKFSGARS